MGDDRSRTFVEQARRKQIVSCAVEVIANEGYPRASLQRIAERAGVSKGVILYHFDGKDDLMNQILQDYVEAENEFIFPAVEAEASAAAAFQTYLRRNIEFMGVNPRHLKALVEIVISAQDAEGNRKFPITSVEWTESEIAYLEELFQRGQKEGVFRSFSTRVMAISVRGAIENIAMHVLTYPDIDLAEWAEELVAMCSRATYTRDRLS